MTDQEFEQSICFMCQGNREGLKNVYEAYLPMIYSHILTIVHSQQSAEDVTSEFFIRLWSAAGDYRGGSGHKAWLLTIARNMAIDYLRKNGRELPVDELPEETGDAANTLEDRICEELTLKQALTTLEEEERQIVDLKIMGELTFAEISKLMKKPLGTVAWKYRVAIGKLKRCRYE